jgi:4-hydroxybenzoate polyprenyltransferase
LSSTFVAGFVVISVLIFALGAAMLNPLTLKLAPLSLTIVLAYSYMKRVTRWSHLVLGLALGIAPSAAWIAVRGSLDPRIIVLTMAVLLWVGGFDVLYACQDFEHDRAVGLNSVPQSFGLNAAFWIARAMHIGMLLMLCWLIVLFGLGKMAVFGVVVVALLLLYEHMIISPKDMRRMNAAFFTLNGVISVVFFAFVAADVLLRR